MFESERGQAERCESVARSLCGHTAVEGVSREFQAEVEVAHNLLWE